MDSETLKAASPWLTSLSTTALLIVCLTVIIFALSKFGVLGKILDGIFESKGINLAEIIKAIKADIETLLKNDVEHSSRILGIEDRTDKLECCYEDFRRESYKKAVYNPDLPLAIRMEQGIKYIKLGGNGETLAYLMEALAPQDRKKWNELCENYGVGKYKLHIARSEI